MAFCAGIRGTQGFGDFLFGFVTFFLGLIGILFVNSVCSDFQFYVTVVLSCTTVTLRRCCNPDWSSLSSNQIDTSTNSKKLSLTR